MPAQFEAAWQVPGPDEVYDLKISWFRYADAEVVTEMRPSDDGVWMIMEAVHEGMPIGSACRLIPWPQ